MKKSVLFLSKSPSRTKKIATNCAKTIKQTTVFALNGNIGSGKTVFIKGLAKLLGVKSEVTSPTFTLLKQYAGRGRWKDWTLYHFDLYRLKKAEDFTQEGWIEIFKRPRSIIAIEWPEIISSFVPKNKIEVSFFAPTAKQKKRLTSAETRERRVLIKGL